MAVIATPPKLQFFDNNGNPLVGGKLYSYAAGTVTPLATYTDAGGGTPNANPVILNSRGEASVWLGTASYKFKLTTSTDVDIWTVDNIAAISSTVSVFGTGVAATDDAAIQAAINLAPVNGVIDLFGTFASSAAKVLKPQLMIRNGGGAIINHTNTATNCFQYDPGGVLGFPGQIVFEGLVINGPWTSGSQALGTQTYSNLKAAIFIDANAPFCQINRCDIRSFYAQVVLRNTYHTQVNGGYFFGGVHGVMLYAECHDTLLNNIECDGNLRTGLSVNYGNPAGKAGNAQGVQAIGGAYQNTDCGVWLESTQGFSGTGTLYFEGNRIRDMQIGVNDSGAYARTANFTRIAGVGSSSPVATASVLPLYPRPQGANIEVSSSIDVYLRGLGFYTGCPTTTENVIVDGFCDRTFVEPAFLSSSAPYLFDSPERVVVDKAGTTNYAPERLNSLTYGVHNSATPIGRGPFVTAIGTPSGRATIVLEALTANADVMLKANASTGTIRFTNSAWAEYFRVDFVNGRLDCNVPITMKVYTVAALPAPSGSIPPGTRAFVSNATATTFASIPVGGGANTVPVYVDGAGAWRIG
jgi:hypothetical protein